MKMARLIGAVALGSLLLAGCSATQVTNSWSDPSAAQKSFSKVLVVAMVPDEAVRRNLETRLVQELAAKGTKAEPGSRFVQPDQKLDRETVVKIVEQEGFDSVMVVNYLGTEKSLEYVPGTYYDYVGLAGPMMYDPGYMHERKEAKLETRFFDAAGGGKLIWSASTSTIDPTSAEQGIASVSKKIVERMDQELQI